MRNKDTSKVIIGAMIGALIGGTALYFLHARAMKKPLLNKIVGALSDIGETLEESRAESADEAIDDIEKSLPEGENVVANALTLIATGIHLWNKFKKGK